MPGAEPSAHEIQTCEHTPAAGVGALLPVVEEPVPERSISLGGGLRVPYPTASSAAASKVGRGNVSRDTRPETTLRSELHRRGLRFRKDHRVDLPQLRVRVDVAFTRQRVAVFVDGCFWHGCPDHGRTPTANRSYWEPKLARNALRDDQVNAALTADGWIVVRVWEHVTAHQAADAVDEALDRRAGRSFPGRDDAAT